MFSRGIQRRSVESTIGNSSSYARWLLDQAGNRSSAGVAVTPETALGLPYVFACINVLSQTLANTPLALRKTEGRGSVVATAHRHHDAVSHKPNDTQTAYKWKETLESHRNGWGNAYAYIDRSNEDAMVMLDPNTTSVHRLAVDGSVVYKADLGGGAPQVISANDIVHVSGLGFDGLKGYTVIHLAAESIGLGLAIHEFGSRFFGSGLNPHGIIESEVPANSLTKWAEQFKEQYGNLANSHGTPVLPKGLSYKPITINPDDAQTLETLKYNRTEIASLYRVPPHFIMDLERSTFTNAAEMNLHFLTHTMTPIFTNWESELNIKLLTRVERAQGYHFKFDTNNILKGTPEGRAVYYHYALQDGWMSRNEAREKENLVQADGLDEFLKPNNMIGLNETPTPDDFNAPRPTGNKDPAARSINELPIAMQIFERMVTFETNELSKADDDLERISKLYIEDYPKFIVRNMLPLATMLDSNPNEFVKSFVAKYTERQGAKDLTQVTVSINDMHLVYLEVKNERS
jgi:HK97 family phage portal protein